MSLPIPDLSNYPQDVSDRIWLAWRRTCIQRDQDLTEETKATFLNFPDEAVLIAWATRSVEDIHKDVALLVHSAAKAARIQYGLAHPRSRAEKPLRAVSCKAADKEREECLRVLHDIIKKETGK